MSFFHGASRVAISDGNLVAAGPGSTVTINQGSHVGVSSAFRDLSAAAAHAAMHDSAARFDAPRCHRNTRAKYRDQLELWMLGKEFEGKQLIWLHGGAGAGKSAIMQSVVEQCAQHDVILGAFFFSRADPSRNYAEVLIPTLAYQLARSFPAVMTVLEPLIHRDPLIFKSSLQTQAYELLVRPILYLFENGIMDNTSPLCRVFVIDGLDECSNTKKQALIIRVVSSILADHGVPVCFLIASRPEMAISSAFEKEKKVHEVFSTITLDNDDDAESDIRQFVEDSFLDIIDSHPWRLHIKLPWPDPESIDYLVKKSSGHFIYVATAMRFISSDNEHPGRALQVVEGLEPSRTGSPFAELDALYMHILTSARYSDQVLEILRHCYLSPISNTVAAVCYIHNISPQDVSLFLSDVQSLVSLRPNSFEELSIASRHASLGDFLKDQRRSQMLFICFTTYCARFLERHFQLLDNGPITASFSFRQDAFPQVVPKGHAARNDVLDLMYGIVSGLASSKDIELLQSLISCHAPHDIWNFCIESFGHDPTISSVKVRKLLAHTIHKYLRAIRDLVDLDDDTLFFEQFKMYIELILDDINDFVHQKPQYRIIPALIFSGGRSGLSAACSLLFEWGRQFHIDKPYGYDFWFPLTEMNSTSRRTNPRAFRALRTMPKCQLAWSSDLAIAMELVLRRLVILPWSGPPKVLNTRPQRRSLQPRKPLKRILQHRPKISLESGFPKSDNLYLWRGFRYWEKISRRKRKCCSLMKAVVCYLHKSDYTSEVLRLANKSLPMVAQWSPRLMKRARYEMDAYVRRWEGPSDHVLKEAKLLPTD